MLGRNFFVRQEIEEQIRRNTEREAELRDRASKSDATEAEKERCSQRVGN